MIPDDLAGDRESQFGSVGLGREEGGEDIFQFFFSYALTRVADVDADPPGFTFSRSSTNSVDEGGR